MQNYVCAGRNIRIFLKATGGKRRFGMFTASPLYTKIKTMFDQILSLVKEHLGNNPEVKFAIPAEHEEAVNHEIASHVTNGLAQQMPAQGGVSGLLSQLQNGLTSGSPVTNAIEGGVVSSLASKFGLSPAITGAIAASLPALLQKFAHKANDPNDSSITPDSISSGLAHSGGGILGNLGNLFSRH